MCRQAWAAPTRVLGILAASLLVPVVSAAPAASITPAAATAPAASTAPEAADPYRTATEPRLLDEIKSGLFDRRWNDVISACDELLARFASSPQAQAAALHRARALASIGGRDEEALAAFAAVGRGAGPLAEEARRLRAQAALAPALAGRAYARAAVEDALGDSARSVRVSAAVVASRLTEPDLRSRAASVLRAEIPLEPNAGLRDEMTLALTRIDPALVQREPDPPAGAAGAGKAPGAPAKWIHLRITSRSNPSEKVAINLPLSFARALFGSLPEKTMQDLRSQVEDTGISWEAFLQSLNEMKASGTPLLSVDDGDDHVEVWVD